MTISSRKKSELPCSAFNYGTSRPRVEWSATFRGDELGAFDNDAMTRTFDRTQAISHDLRRTSDGKLPTSTILRATSAHGNELGLLDDQTHRGRCLIQIGFRPLEHRHASKFPLGHRDERTRYLEAVALPEVLL